MEEARPENDAPGRVRVSTRSAFGVGAVVLVAVVALIATLVWPGYLNRDEAYAFNGGTWDPPNQASPIDLIDQDSQPFTLDSRKGKVVLVFFGYTYCPNFCPTTMLEVQKVKSLLGEQANEVDVLFVTVDPERDLPARLKEYLAFFDPTFVGLSGTDAQIDAIKLPWGVLGAKQPADANGQYLVDHTTSLYAIDPDGNLRLVWGYGTSPEDIAEDIEHILP